MRSYFTLARRELAGYFVSLTGYVIIAVVVLLLGLSFTYLLEVLNGQAVEMPVTDLFYDAFFFWLILLLATPVITMRSFALEKYSGTYETLMTTPVGELEVVLAKFTSVFVFYVVMWLPLLACLFVVRHYTQDRTALDWGALASTFLGIALVGAVYTSLGCFASVLSRSQIIAAMISFALGIALFLLSFFSFLTPPRADWQSRFFNYISMFSHMQDFVRGIVDARSLVFYLSLTVFFLFLTLKVVESQRWK
ncbi:MAG: ABC transporter permease [Verrucomicrobia bacterium]|nr:ABC transporter permease [Verrucomicrobiota bacterium]